MPQASDELRALWRNDAHAWAHLAPNFTEHAGDIRRKPGYEPTERDYSALDYLFQEWDYTYSDITVKDGQ
jgi:hypothetical protein